MPALRRCSPQHPGLPRWVLQPGMPPGGVCSPWDVLAMRTPLLPTQAASAALGSKPGVGLLWKWGLIPIIPTKPLSEADTCFPAGRRRARSPEMLSRAPGTNGTRVTLLGEEEEEAAAAQAAVLTIVPVFCAMGLLGILVCNLLKKKGYHCTASKEPQPGGTGEPW